MPGLPPHRPQLLPACPGGAGGLRELPVPASYPRGEGGFGISLPTALLSFPARLSAWIPTAPALTVPGGMGRWLSRSQSRTGTPGHRAWGGYVPACGLALLGELWHPVGAVGGASPPGAVCPHCAWLASQGRTAGQPHNSGTHLASIVPWEPRLQSVPSHPSGACPGQSWGSGVSPPAGAVLGTAGQGRGADGCWRGSALLSQGL